MTESTGEKQMTASEKSELYDVLRGIQTGTVDREVATEVQGIPALPLSLNLKNLPRA